LFDFAVFVLDFSAFFVFDVNTDLFGFVWLVGRCWQAKNQSCYKYHISHLDSFLVSSIVAACAGTLPPTGLGDPTAACVTKVAPTGTGSLVQGDSFMGP
jgi:hypothetical protein